MNKMRIFLVLLFVVMGNLGGLSSAIADPVVDSDQVEFLLFEGSLDLDAGRVTEAIRSFSQAVDLDPERFEAHLYYARALIRGIGESQGKDGEAAVATALTHFQWVLEREPGNREARLGVQFLKALTFKEKPPPFATAPALAAWERGQAALADENARTAIREFKKASRLEPKVVAVHKALGDVLLGEKRTSEAIQSYEAGLDLSPKEYGLLVALGKAHETVGDLDLALTRYQAAFEVNSRAPHAASALVHLLRGRDAESPEAADLTLLGRAQLALNQTDEAEKTLKAALAIEPTLAAKKALGITHYLKSDDESALLLLQEVHLGDPDDIEVRYYIGACQLRQGKIEAGHETLKNLLETAPRNPNAMRLLGLSLADDPEKAEDAAKLLIAAHSAGAAVKNLPCLLGTLYMRLGHTFDAFQAFEDCLQINPDFAGAYFGLGVIADDLGRTREAIDFFKEYLEREETPDRSAIFRMGVAYLRSGQDEIGFQTLRRVVQPNAANGDTAQLNDTELLEATSYFLAAVRRYKDAIFIGEMLLNRDSDNAIYNNNLAMTYADANKKPGRAHTLALKANRLAPKNPGHMDTLGWALVRLSRLEEAEKTLLASVELANTAGLTNLSEIYYHLGFLYHKLARPEDAIAYLDRAMENPPTPYLRDDIERLLEQKKAEKESR